MERTALINPWLETCTEDQPYPSDIDDVETADFFEETGEEMMMEHHDHYYRNQGPKAACCSGERMGIWFVSLLLLTFAGGISLLSCSYRKQCLGWGSKGEQSSASESSLGGSSTFAPTASVMAVTIQQETPSPAMRTIISSLAPSPSATKVPTRDKDVPAVESSGQPQPKTASPTSFLSRIAPEVPPASPMPTTSSSFVTPSSTEAPVVIGLEQPPSPSPTIQDLATLFPITAVVPDTSTTKSPSRSSPLPINPSVSTSAAATEVPSWIDDAEQPKDLATLVPTPVMSGVSSEVDRIQALPASPLPSPSASLVGQATAAPALTDLEQTKDLVTLVPTSSFANRVQPQQLSLAPTPAVTTSAPVLTEPAAESFVATGQPKPPDTTAIVANTPTSTDVVSKTGTKLSPSSAPTSSPTLHPTTSQPTFPPSTLAPTVSPTTGSKSSKNTNNQKTNSPTAHPSPVVSSAGTDPRTQIPTPEPILAFIPLVAAPTLKPTSLFNNPPSAVLAVEAPTLIPKGNTARIEATPVSTATDIVNSKMPASSAATSSFLEPSTAEKGRVMSFPFLAEYYQGDILVSSEQVDYPAHYQAFGFPADPAITIRYTSKVHVVDAPVPLIIELWYGWEAVDVWVDNVLYDDNAQLLEEGSHAVLIECRGLPGQGIQFNAALFWERTLYTMEEAGTEIRSFLDEHYVREGDAVRVVTVQIAGSNDPYLETVVDATSYDTSDHKVFLILATLGSVNWVVEGSSVIGVAFSHQPASKVHGVEWAWPILELQYVDDLRVWETFTTGKTPDQSIELEFTTEKVVL